MRRLRPVLPVLFAILGSLAALPACHIDLGHPDDDDPPPPDANLCATPPEGACGPDECETRGGCILYSCDPATGQTVQVVCESPPAAIDGAWHLDLSLDGEDPCPGITRTDAVDVSVVPGPAFTTAAILAPGGALLDTAEVSPQFAQTGVRFTLHPIWSGAEGAEVPAHVEYDVTVYSSGTIDGFATATATSGDQTCSYTFDVSGGRR